MRNRSSHRRRPRLRARRFVLITLLALMAPVMTPATVATAAPPNHGTPPITSRPAAAALAVACGPAGESAPTETPWPLRRLDPHSVWPLTQGEGVVVAVIDSGVSANHPALAGQVLPGRDYNLPEHGGRCDEVGHGTLIAGIIAGRPGTGAPFSGIAPKAQILPVRVLRDAEHTRDESLPDTIAAAIRWAVDNGADVINLSLETTIPTEALANAVAYARERDVVLVAAAGNQKADQQRHLPAYPAGYQSVIAVAGIDEQGQHVDTSISGDYIDVAAPGLEIQGPAPQGKGYRTETGTSYATAYVSGVAALIRARHPNLSADAVARRIRYTADSPPEGRNSQVGYGVVNPYRAVNATLGSRSNPPLEALAPPAPPADPQATAKTIAILAAVSGVVVAVLLLLAAPVLRRGRRRGWAVASTPQRS
ncbi:MAG TPA: type VII secretion-associated serine protease mycosin [Micromonospora sp.]|nr:type VII secretion-associated serine protease mycosin [Micromonospora sp.]